MNSNIKSDKNAYDAFIDMDREEMLTVDGGAPSDKFAYGLGFFTTAWEDYWCNVGEAWYDYLH